MVANLKLVSNTGTIPPNVSRRDCISTRRMQALKYYEDNSNGGSFKRWHEYIEIDETHLSDLQRSVADGTAKQERLLSAVQTLNSHCDHLRDVYRSVLSRSYETQEARHQSCIHYTNANIGEVVQMAELKEVLVNARARKVMMDWCGKNLTTAAERIATGADLAWAEKEFECTSQGWLTHKKKLSEELAKLI